MLARRSTFTHPIAGQMDLPLLIPAFSSKGFQFATTGQGKARRKYSTIAYELADFGKFPSRSVLVSAYDLHFHYFDAPKLPKNRPEVHLRQSTIVFVDSGGYELSADFDITEPRTFGHVPEEGYAEDEYQAVLERLRNLKQALPLVITNFDRAIIGKPLEQQITAARTLFNANPGCGTDFILKPWSRDSRIVDPDRLAESDIQELRGFDIIGVTDKELGRDVFDRLKRVARLRRKLDDGGIESPIHVWGGLDPLMTPLFFFAGAEVFDGISWLRYAFHNGVATYRECYGVLSELGVTGTRQMNHAYASIYNRSMIERLEIALQQWCDFDGTRFDMFDSHVQSDLERAYKVMCSKICFVRGGA